MTITDHRKVPLEVIRDAVRSAAELTSFRAVAEDAGVGRSTLQAFIARGSTPHPRIRRLLAMWYIRVCAGIEETELIRPYRDALAVLVGDVPGTTREQSLGEVLEGVARGHLRAGEPVPRWVEVVRMRIDRGSFWDRAVWGECDVSFREEGPAG